MGTIVKENPIIKEMVGEIVGLCSPLQVFLVSYKTDVKGEPASFKLCAVVGDGFEDIKKLEADIQVKTNCPVPCDVVIYTVSEWNECIDDDCTFAYRVENAGDIVYEQERRA
jgi:hypothetical protein